MKEVMDEPKGKQKKKTVNCGVHLEGVVLNYLSEESNGCTKGKTVKIVNCTQLLSNVSTTLFHTVIQHDTSL